MLNSDRCHYVMELIHGAGTLFKKQCEQPIECYIDNYCHHHCLTHFDLRRHLLFETPIIPEHLKGEYKKWNAQI